MDSQSHSHFSSLSKCLTRLKDGVRMNDKRMNNALTDTQSGREDNSKVGGRHKVGCSALDDAMEMDE